MLDYFAAERLIPIFVEWGERLALAVFIYALGRLLTKWILRLTVRLLERVDTDVMLVKFVRSVANIFLTLVVLILVLDQLGVPTASLIAVLGAAGLAVGLAMQDSLKNFASGVMLIFFRPFQLGDYVEAAGHSGEVEAINMFSSALRTPDNKTLIVPNGMIYNDIITNYTARKRRRLDMIFAVGYGEDLQQARQVIKDILAQESRVLPEPEPDIVVAELGNSSVNFYVRPWVKTDDYWQTKFDLTERIKLAFDAAGISIPFPQMDVHVETAA